MIFMALQIHAEVERRRNLAAQSAERALIIRETYEPLHRHVYSLQVQNLTV